MKLWITGANGLVGNTLKEKAAFATGREVDITDYEAVSAFAQKNRVTHIVNCAAFSEVDPAETRRDEAYASNALGPEVLGRVAKKMGLRLLHISTDYVFDGQGTMLKEEDSTAPCNVYGASKLEGEKRLLSVFPECCILRTSWVFGKGGKNFVTKLLELLQTKDQLQLVDDQIGRPTYAPDLAKVILQLLNTTGIFHFANAGPTNKYEFALAVQEMAKAMQLPMKCSSIKPVPSSTFATAAKRSLYSALDTAKIEKHLSFQVRHWRDCLTEYLHA